MKKVEILRTAGECRACNETAQLYDAMPPCNTCKRTTAEWIDTVTNFWGTHAVLQMENGKVDKVPLYRIKVIEETE